MESSDDTPRHLFRVDYEKEAERKRVEYLFNNWDSGEINAPEGLVRIAENVDREALHEKLLTKVDDEQIEVFELKSTSLDLEEQHETAEEDIDASLDAVETFVDYMLSKKKAVVQEGSQDLYEIYTKKGLAEVRPTLQETDDGVTVRIHIDGYPPAPSFLKEFFEAELSEFATSQSPKS
jgi:hypothetical protein